LALSDFLLVKYSLPGFIGFNFTRAWLTSNKDIKEKTGKNEREEKIQNIVAKLNISSRVLFFLPWLEHSGMRRIAF
ncbi:hypothetical protein ACJX0J_006435, partial [Zea mays]